MMADRRRLAGTRGWRSRVITVTIVGAVIVVAVILWPGSDDRGEPVATATGAPAVVHTIPGTDGAEAGQQIRFIPLTGAMATPVEAQPGDGVDSGLHRSFDTALLSGVSLDPDRLIWIAVTSRPSYQDSPTGDAAPDGTPDVLGAEIDDYASVSIFTGGDEATTTLGDNDAAGTPIGNQAALAGSVQVVAASGSDGSGDESVRPHAPIIETGAFDGFIEEHGAGSYDFAFTFFNRFTERAGYPVLWLVIAERN